MIVAEMMVFFSHFYFIPFWLSSSFHFSHFVSYFSKSIFIKFYLCFDRYWITYSMYIYMHFSIITMAIILNILQIGNTNIFFLIQSERERRKLLLLHVIHKYKLIWQSQTNNANLFYLFFSFKIQQITIIGIFH